jgi:hypothetical protein
VPVNFLSPRWLTTATVMDPPAGPPGACRRDTVARRLRQWAIRASESVRVTDSVISESESLIASLNQ